MYIAGASKVMNATSVTINTTSYSDSILFSHCSGFASCLIVSTAGSITVTMQASLDGVTFYDVVNSSNSAVGAVAATMTVGSRWVQFSPVLAPYVRFKVVEGNVATTSVSITLIPQELTN